MILGLEHLGHVYDLLIRDYVAASRVPMLVVDYRIAPEHPHPTPVEDCYAALRWLTDNAAALGADPTRIAVMGDSAGTDTVSDYAAPARTTDLSGLPDAYIDVGDLDIFRDEDITYAQRLSDAGVATEFHLHAGCPHAFEALARKADVSQRAIDDRPRRLRVL
jgi:acetyl esterase/lipase